jgi:hypothetical protein
MRPTIARSRISAPALIAHGILAAGDALAEPEKLLLLVLVGGEVLKRPRIRAGLEGDNRKPGLGELAGERAAAGAGADNRKIG